MKRNLRSLTNYKENIGELHEQMTEVVKNSFNDWNQLQEFSHSLGIGYVAYKPRTKAAIIHDHICHRIINVLETNSDVRVGEFNGVFGFLYKDLFFIRFKKMNPDSFRTSSIDTKQSRKYLYQNTSIPGLPEQPTILYVGYSLDKSSSTIKGIYTACWDGTHLKWIDEHGVESFEQATLDFNNTQDNKLHLEIEKVIKRVTVKDNIKKREKRKGTN